MYLECWKSIVLTKNALFKKLSIKYKEELRNNTRMSQEFSINFNASLSYSFQFLNYLPGFHGHEINNQP